MMNKIRKIVLNEKDKLRFKKYVSAHKTERGCIEWVGGTTGKSGYGYFRVGEQKFLAHRIAYLTGVGEFDERLIIMHSCDNRACVNPMHLMPGTQSENMVDAVTKKRLLHYKGEKNAAAKLNDSDIPLIRERLLTGICMRTVAKEFGVGKSTIFRIAHNRLWAHV